MKDFCLSHVSITFNSLENGSEIYISVMNASHLYKQNKTIALIDQEKLQNATKFNKDDCCEITIAHPILEAATIIVSPSLPRSDSKMYQNHLT